MPPYKLIYGKYGGNINAVFVIFLIWFFVYFRDFHESLIITID